jgi:phenylacetate-CoA ligase
MKSGLKVDPLKDWSLLQKIHLRIYFLTIPFHGWIIRKSTYKKLQALLSSQWDSYEKIKRRREISLRDILDHAAKNTIWYNKTLSKKVGPSSQWKQLDGIPLLEKEDIKTIGPIQFMDFTNSYITHKIATSGSTGSPMIIFADREQLEWRFAATLRALTWTGWKIGKKQLRLWHQKIGMKRGQVYKEKLDAFLLRRKFVPAFEFNEEKVEELFLLIEKYKPFIIDGYAESFDYLTKHDRLIQHKTGAVMSSAQTLTSQVRSKLEKKITKKVYDKYGSREFSGIAYECGKGPWFHVVSECYIIEILDSELNQVQPGQTGEIVVTDLKNKVMPMIRYRIGDIATAVDETKPCECGRESQRIGAIAGRTAALIVTPLGRSLPGTFFAHFFKDYEEIVNHFQIIQEKPHEIKMKIVKGRSWSEEAFKQLLDDLSEFLDGLRMAIEFVSIIPLGRTGKRSPVISTLDK